MAKHEIAGEWRGHYDYHNQADEGCGFTVFISESSGNIQGTVVDDYVLGKATFSGIYAHPSVEFTKIYCNPRRYSEPGRHAGKNVRNVRDSHHPVQYEGSMSEDGKTMSGKWRIEHEKNSATGSWTAYRIEEEEEEAKLKESAGLVKERQLNENVI
jgi:hypothetical protein